MPPISSILLAFTALVLAGGVVFFAGFQAADGRLPGPSTNLIWAIIGFALTILIVQIQFSWQYRETVELQRGEARQRLRAELYRELSGTLGSLKSSSRMAAQLSYDLAFISSFEITPLFPHDELESLKSLHESLARSISEATALIDSYLIISERMSPLNDTLRNHNSYLSSNYRSVLMAPGEDPSPELREALLSYASTADELHSAATDLLILAQNTLLGDLFESKIEEIPETDSELALSSRSAAALLAKARQLKRAGSLEDRQITEVGLRMWEESVAIGLQLLQLSDSVPMPEEVARLAIKPRDDSAFHTILRNVYSHFASRTDKSRRLSTLVQLVRVNRDAAVLWLEVMEIGSASEVLEMADGIELDAAVERDLETVKSQWKSRISKDLDIRITAESAVVEAGSDAIFSIEILNSTGSVLPSAAVRLRVDKDIPRDMEADDIILSTEGASEWEVTLEATQAIISIKDLVPTSEYYDIAVLSVPTVSYPGTLCVRGEASPDETFESASGDIACVTLSSGPEMEMYQGSGFIDQGGVFQSAKTHFRLGDSEGDYVYQIIVTNNGLESLTGLVVRDTLLAGDSATLDSIRPGYPTKGSAQLRGRALDWQVGVLAGGESAEIEIYATARSQGRIVNRATAHADQLAGLIIQDSESIVE